MPNCLHFGTLQAALHEPIERGPHARQHSLLRRHRRRRRRENRRDQARRAAAGKRRAPGGHFVEQSAQGEDVGSGVGLPPSSCSARNVLQRAENACPRSSVGLSPWRASSASRRDPYLGPGARHAPAQSPGASLPIASTSRCPASGRDGRSRGGAPCRARPAISAPDSAAPVSRGSGPLCEQVAGACSPSSELHDQVVEPVVVADVEQGTECGRQAGNRARLAARGGRARSGVGREVGGRTFRATRRSRRVSFAR